MPNKMAQNKYIYLHFAIKAEHNVLFWTEPATHTHLWKLELQRRPTFPFMLCWTEQFVKIAFLHSEMHMLLSVSVQIMVVCTMLPQVCVVTWYLLLVSVIILLKIVWMCCITVTWMHAAVQRCPVSVFLCQSARTIHLHPLALKHLTADVDYDGVTAMELEKIMYHMLLNTETSLAWFRQTAFFGFALGVCPLDCKVCCVDISNIESLHY